MTNENLKYFDALADMAAAKLGAQSCLISISDRDALFALGSSGRDGAPDDRSVPSRGTICQHTIRAEWPLRVPDVASCDWIEVQPDADAVGVGAYLGVPILNGQGVVIGVVCAVSEAPRDWSDADLEHLENVAAMASEKIELEARRLEGSALERTISETDRILLALAQADRQATSVHDANGALLFANRAVFQGLGLSEAELRNLPSEVIRRSQTPEARDGDAMVRVDLPERGQKWLRIRYSRAEDGLTLCDWTAADAPEAEGDAVVPPGSQRSGA